MLNVKEITDKNFEKATFGYKPEEVNDFLKEVAASYAAALKSVQESEAKIIKLVEKINEYRADEEAIKQTLLTAQKSANHILSDAKAEAEKMLADAKAEHAKLIESNKAESDRIIKENNERCERLIKETADRTEQKIAAIKLEHENAKDNLDKMKVESTKFKAMLFELYNKQILMINELPELSEEEIQKAIQEKTAKINAARAASVAKEVAEEPVAPVIKENVASKEELGFADTYKKPNDQLVELKFGKNN